MKRMPYQRPTDHYDKRIMPIDERLCELLKLRKEVSQGNPGYPPFELIQQWASSAGLYEEYLKTLFGLLMEEKAERFKPVIEPAGFRKHISVLRSMEQNGLFYTLTTVKQYENASVVVLNIDWDGSNDDPMRSKTHVYELMLGADYECRFDRGNGGTGHFANSYVVTPPLPDDLTGINFLFKPMPAYNPSTNVDVVFNVDDQH